MAPSHKTLAITHSQVHPKSNQSTLRASFQYAGCLTVHSETRAVGMFKNCTKEEALKLAYEHK